MRSTVTLRRVLRALTCAAFALAGEPALARGLYAQIVTTFPEARGFSQAYNKQENAVVLEFQHTSPAELKAFETYDERLVRRVVMKDLGPAGTEVKVVLRDRSVRAVVTKFQEPYRVTVDLFDADYAEERDPTTGLPLVNSKSSSATYGGEGGGQDTADGGNLQLVDESDLASGKDATTANAASVPATKHKLLQPAPSVFVDPSQMEGALRQAGDGIGRQWAEYPPYVYRLQTAAFEDAPARDRAPAVSPELLDSARLMADYAGKMFNMGHEAKALVAYQQVLHLEPSLFDKDALHLWKFAETHLGQGNLTLARGYYEAITEKHPESPLAAFAKLRVLDVTAIRLLQHGRYADVPALVAKLETIKARHGGEFATQLALRRAYWSAQGLPADPSRVDRSHLPYAAPATIQELAANLNQVESKRTGFLAASIVLGDQLRADVPWMRTAGPFAESYFKSYTGPAAEPYRSQLEAALTKKLNANLQAKVAAGKLIEAIDDYEAVPKSLRKVVADQKTAWALAESYRQLGQPENAVDFYAAAARTDADGPDRFRAEFWLSVTAGDVAVQARANKAGDNKITKFKRQSEAADERAWAAWQRLKDDERRALMVAYKAPFEATVTSAARTKTGPRIVLAAWTQRLGTTATTSAAGTAGAAPGGDWEKAFSPSGGAVILLGDLGKRLREFGRTSDARQAVGLMRYMKPADFADDNAAKAIWAKQLIGLADDYRQANEYLDAGRLYSQVGSASEDWEGRAEALYKGGLLLYRAGRREEAIQAFKQAADDGDNLLYANLAKERLSQLE